MRLSTKGRYAVTAMLDLALNSGKGPVTLADISVNQGISLSYLEQLFAALRSKQLVRGVRGPGGGYYLGKPAEEVSIADIICAVDEWVEFTRCGGRENCRDGKRCLTHTHGSECRSRQHFRRGPPQRVNSTPSPTAQMMSAMETSSAGLPR